MFVTMLVGIYDSNSKELLISNAGHEPPIILNDKSEFSNFNEAGPPLGIVKKTPYKEYKIKFEKSSMYIFTDGITEIKNVKGDELGSKGFQQYITKFKDKPKSERLKSIIDSGKFSMASDYAEIFKEANDNGPHIVFSIQYDKSVAGLGNAQPSQVPKMAAEIPFQGVTRRQMVSADLYNSYEVGDKRRDLTVINGYTSTADGVFVDNELFWGKYAICLLYTSPSPRD